MTAGANEAYDEFGLFHENAVEVGLPYEKPPVVKRCSFPVGEGRHLSGLVWGETPPEFVFLHGGGQNAHTWDTLALALDRPLLALDLPGHGHSDWKDDGNYRPNVLEADVAVAIAAAAPTAKAVVGMSLGGMTAISLAVSHPELVRKLVVIDISPGVNPEKAKSVINFLRGPETFTSFDEILDRTVQFNPQRSVSSLRRGILHNAYALPDGTWTWRYDRRRPETSPRQAKTQEIPPNPASPPDSPSLEDMITWDDIAATCMPFLFVKGGASPMVDADDLAALHKSRPDLQIRTIEGAGHSVQGDRPRELAGLIAAFSDSTTRMHPATSQETDKKLSR